MSSAAHMAARLPPEAGPFAAAWRLESWAGEVRVNLVRLAALVVFYANHLVNIARSPDDPTLAGAYHLSATTLVMVWATGVMVLYRMLAQHRLPPALKYVVTLWDTILITSLVMLAGGPKSPLVILYFLVVAAAPLRLSRTVVYVATLASIAAYLFLLGHYVFFVVGQERYYANSELRIPRSTEAIYVLSLGAAGILAGQVVRQARRLVESCATAVEPQSVRASAMSQTVAVSSETEARRDSRVIGVGLILVAILVGLGLILAFTHRPADGAGPPLWLVIGITLVFLAAVAAAVMELMTPANRSLAPPGGASPDSSAQQSAREGP